MRIIHKATLVTLGSFLACTAVRAQDTLAGVGAASAAGASIDASSAGSALSAGKATHNVGRATKELMNDTDRAGDLGANAPDASGAGGASSGPGGTGAGAAAAASTTAGARAAFWGTSGTEYLHELMSAPTYSSGSGAVGNSRAARRARYLRARAEVVRRSRRHSRRRHGKLQMASYQAPAHYWLYHYLPEDQYKIEAGDWRFVSDEADKYYYSPDAPGIIAKNPDHVLGFHTWQDAMIAGYRPDPHSKPTPGAQFATLDAVDPDGPMLTTYVQVAYGGQLTPSNFDATWRYCSSVLGEMNKYPYAYDLRGGVIEKVMEAALTGNKSLIPASVGGEPYAGGAEAMSGATPNDANGVRSGGSQWSQPNLGDGPDDKRMDQFNNFSNRAGNLANVPANNGK